MRSILNPIFTYKNVAKRVDYIRGVADEILSEQIDGDETIVKAYELAR